MLAIWPSVYPSDPILDVLTLNGAPGAYNKNKGAGVGISWAAESGMRASANYVAANGASATPVLKAVLPPTRLEDPAPCSWVGRRDNWECCCHLFPGSRTVKT